MKKFTQSPLFAALLVLLAAICFSAKAVLVKLAYRYEVDSISLLTLRMTFSLPIFLAIGWWANRGQRNNQSISRKDITLIAVFGVAGFYMAALFDFIGLQYITASLERIVLFIYPTLVILISAIFLKKKIKRVHYIALTLTYLGIAIAFLENLTMDKEEHFLLGAFFIFLAALAYAIYLIGSGILVPRVGTLRYNSFCMSFAALAIILHHALAYRLELFHFEPQVYYLTLIMALFATVVPSFLITEGIRIIGANNTAIIGSIGPISTIGLAYIFLGERLGILQWIGTVLVIVGVLIISLNKNNNKD